MFNLSFPLNIDFGDLIAIFALIASIAAVIATIVISKSNSIQTKAYLDIFIMDKISNAEAHLFSSKEDDSAFSDVNLETDNLAQAINDSYKNAVKRYLRAYNEACEKFFNGDISTDSFSSKYGSEINAIFSDAIFSQYLSFDQFSFLLRYHEEHPSA